MLSLRTHQTVHPQNAMRHLDNMGNQQYSNFLTGFEALNLRPKPKPKATNKKLRFNFLKN